MLTLKPGADGDLARTRFFDFIREFVRSRFDLKLVLCFRTEYFGEYDARINQEFPDNPLSMRGYRLPEFDLKRVEEAIKLPTQRTEIPGFGVPYQQYGFSYAEGVPKRIAEQIAGTVQSGVLPAMQIVCQRLYELTKSRRPSECWEITEEDLERMGGVEGQIDAYLTHALFEPCERQKLSSSHTLREIVRWRSVLHRLARVQADGSVTTDLIKRDDLRHLAFKEKCRIDFDQMAEYLANEDPEYPRILRQTELMEVGSPDPLKCYSLAHDVLGLALQRWYEGQAQTIRLGARMRLGVLLASIGCIAVSGFLLALEGDSWAFAYVLALGIIGLIFRFTVRLTDWLTDMRFFMKAFLVLIVPQQRQLRIMRDPRFRVYLEISPVAREYLERKLIRTGASKKSNYWFEYNEGDTAFVFVHGIFSDSAGCWKDPRPAASGAPSWPELVLKDDRLGRPAIYMGGYYTLLESGPSNLRDCSNLVFSALNRREPGRSPVMAKKTLVFICHSTGGLVLRHLLESNHPAFRDKIVRILFIGATRYSRSAHLRHLFDRRIMHDLDWAEQFQDVDERFRAMLDNNRIPTARVTEAFEAEAMARPSLRSGGSPRFEPPTILPGTDHFSCVRPDSLSHPAHELLVRVYRGLTSPVQAPVAAGDSAPVPAVVRPFLAPPRSTVPFVGRKNLLERLNQELVAPAVVALYGPRGSGKTSLAVQVTYDTDIQDRFSGGVLWAPLGREPDVRAVLGQWCSSLGMSDEEIASLSLVSDRQRWIRKAIGDRAFFIVIEDASSADVAHALICGGPKCSYLVTTQNRDTALDIAPDHSNAITDLTEDESVALLKKLAPSLGDEGNDITESIIGTVGRTPLTLTLVGRLIAKEGPASAAKLLKYFSPEQTEAEQASPAESPAQAAIRLSYGSLDSKAQQMLRIMAELPPKPNSFSQSAVLNFAGSAAELDEVVRAGTVEPLGAGRCTVDAAVRDYVRGQAGAAPETCRALVEYYTDYVETHSSEYGAVEIESRNILAALDVARANAWIARYLKGAIPLATYLEMRGSYELAGQLYNGANALAQQMGNLQARALALLGRGRLAEKVTRYDVASADLQAALALARQVGDVNTAASAMASLGVVLANLGKGAGAQEILDQALALDPNSVAPETRVDLLARRGRMATHSKDYELSRRYNSEALALAETTGNRERIAFVLTNLGMLEYYQHNLGAAEQYARRGLQVAEEIGYSERQAGLLQALGLIAAERGQVEEAEAYFHRGIDVAERIGHRWYLAAINAVLGDAYLDQKDLRLAEQAYTRALDNIESPSELRAQSLFGLARIAALRDQWESARSLGADSQAEYQTMGDPNAARVNEWLTTVPAPKR